MNKSNRAITHAQEMFLPFSAYEFCDFETFQSGHFSHLLSEEGTGPQIFKLTTRLSQ